MKLEVRPGKYIVAVSGGVDSMVLLHMLAQLPDIELIVAHFDHGIRSDSAEDRKLVQKTAATFGLPFVYEVAKFGADASEAEARRARYDFLERTMRSYGGAAIITAHHQDDVLETAVINVLRGTNRRGLSSLRSGGGVVRPLLNVSKAELKAYAENNDVQWREDSTNASDAYLRNTIRQRLTGNLTEERRRQLVALLKQVGQTNAQIDDLLLAELTRISDKQGITRANFNQLNHAVAREVLALWLRQAGLREYDKKLLDRLVVAAKTARPGSSFDVLQGATMQVTGRHLALKPAKR